MQRQHITRGSGLTRRGVLSAGAAAYLARALTGCSSSSDPVGGRGPNPGMRGRPGDIGALGAPLDIGIRVPEGFTARVLGRAGQIVPGRNLRWHTDPDGGATYPSEASQRSRRALPSSRSFWFDKQKYGLP